MHPDQALVDYVNRMLNSGRRDIPVPHSLLAGASREANETVRQMCQLCGAEVVVVPG